MLHLFCIVLATCFSRSSHHGHSLVEASDQGVMSLVRVSLLDQREEVPLIVLLLTLLIIHSVDFVEGKFEVSKLVWHDPTSYVIVL